MPSLNNVILMGGLTRDPELRRTGGGTAITKLSLAVSEQYKNKAGENVETTCYVDIDAWGRLGENCAQYLAKGSPILVQGKLQFEQWEAKDGAKRSKLSVRAADVQFLGKAPAAEAASEQPPAAEPSTPPKAPTPDPWDEEEGEVPF